MMERCYWSSGSKKPSTEGGRRREKDVHLGWGMPQFPQLRWTSEVEVHGWDMPQVPQLRWTSDPHLLGPLNGVRICGDLAHIRRDQGYCISRYNYCILLLSLKSFFLLLSFKSCIVIQVIVIQESRVVGTDVQLLCDGPFYHYRHQLVGLHNSWRHQHCYLAAFEIMVTGNSVSKLLNRVLELTEPCGKLVKTWPKRNLCLWYSQVSYGSYGGRLLICFYYGNHSFWEILQVGPAKDYSTDC